MLVTGVLIFDFNRRPSRFQGRYPSNPMICFSLSPGLLCEMLTNLLPFPDRKQAGNMRWSSELPLSTPERP